jgi:hypothetical protein
VSTFLLRNALKRKRLGVLSVPLRILSADGLKTCFKVVALSFHIEGVASHSIV